MSLKDVRITEYSFKVTRKNAIVIEASRYQTIFGCKLATLTAIIVMAPDLSHAS